MKSEPFHGRVVLLIEDEIDVRETHRAILVSLGARVVVSASGFEGLDQLARSRPDVVLCDLTMPIMDGLEFAQRVRLDPRSRSVLLIAVTAEHSPSDRIDTWSAGFDGYLVKPLTVEMLAAVARRVSGVRAESRDTA